MMGKGVTPRKTRKEGCDKAFGGKTTEFIHVHFPCLPAWQLVQAIFCLAQEQPLQRALFPLHLQHGILDYYYC